MLQLPNACKCSTPAFFPKNYNDAGANISLDWCINYYFYQADGARSPHTVKSGINYLKTLTERREAIKRLMEELLQALKTEGYNPVTGESKPEQLENDVLPETAFIVALRFAHDKIKAEDQTKKDLKSVIKYTELAAIALHNNFMPVGQVRRKNIKILLDKIKQGKKKWTENTYNYYRSHLKMLFEELMEYDAVEVNPVLGIKKQKYTKDSREVLSDEQRVLVDKHLREVNYRFWRFLHIFFHSGGRITELLAVKAKHVNINYQVVTVLSKKGKESRWIDKTIKDLALPLWIEAMEYVTDPEMYVFHDLLQPALAEKPIRREQISRRWKLWVKDKLGIKADFYSLKHLHTTEVVDLLSDAAAAKHNGHTTTAMVNNVYDIKSKKRKQNLVQGLQNKFA